MLMPFSKEITQAHPTLYKQIQNKYLQNILLYTINSKYRKAVTLKNWIKEQVNNPTQELKDYADSITTNSDYDTQALIILKRIQRDILYTPDSKAWDMNEYWQTGQETHLLKGGDCEDGAILMYVLCRLKGIPSDRLLIMAGDVKGGGHCWLAYKGNEFPLNPVFLDWCYWYTSASVQNRNKFYIDENIIYEYLCDGNRLVSNYYKLWFAFNEDTSITKYKYEK